MQVVGLLIRQISVFRVDWIRQMSSNGESRELGHCCGLFSSSFFTRSIFEVIRQARQRRLHKHFFLIVCWFKTSGLSSSFLKRMNMLGGLDESIGVLGPVYESSSLHLMSDDWISSGRDNTTSSFDCPCHLAPCPFLSDR